MIDESGGLRTLAVGRGVTGLDALTPGANVAFNLGAAGTGVNVTGITSLGNTPVFANGVAFPPVNGQFVSFNQRTGLLTLDTPTAGRVTFPVGGTVAGGLSGLRPGRQPEPQLRRHDRRATGAAARVHHAACSRSRGICSSACS